jgi:uncharacterized protein YggT (Ycf19 family)
VIYLVQFVNYTLALGMWLILGRAMLGILTGGRPSPIQTIFDRFTAPLFALTRRALPFVNERFAPLAALLLLGILRVALIIFTHPAAGR